LQPGTPAEADTSQIDSLRGPKSHKKDKLGSFAKLLEGLIGKSKNRTAGKNNQTTHETEEIKGPSKAKKIFFAGNGEKNAPLEETSEGIWALLGQNGLKTGQNQVLSPETGPEDAVLTLKKPVETAGTGKADNLSHSKGLFPKADSLSLGSEPLEEGFSLSDGLESEEKDLSSSMLLKREDNQGAKAGGTGRGAVDLLLASARKSPDAAALHQFTGNPRPGLANALPGSENGETRGNRLSEGRRKGREKFNLEVRDLKTGEIREAGSSETVKPASFGEPGARKADIELTVDLHPKGREGGTAAGNTGNFGNRGLEDALSRELRENLNTDIVKQASILVRNQQEGTIRLTLKPETLGNVKIRLEMAENKITGHIIVESSEALKAFERELPVLEKAFRDSGFSETSLDMSMAQDGGTYNNPGQEDGDFRSFVPALAASRYDAGMVERELIPEGFFPEHSGEKAVNMLV
jgi:hypothetical protein